MVVMDDRVEETGEDFISISVGLAAWTNAEGFYVVEKDYHVGGEVWRVHKYDPDPFPSRPHAHCIGCRRRFIGCKLHLGTRQLFNNRNDPVDKFLDQSQFDRLICASAAEISRDYATIADLIVTLPIVARQPERVGQSGANAR
jgi:hypothetical protein